MANPLLSVPGLGGFLAAQDQQRAADADELRSAVATMGVLEHLQKRQLEQARRTALAQSGGDPAKAMPLLLKAGDVSGAHNLASLLEEQRKQNAPRVVSPGSQVLGPNNEVLHTAPFAPQRPQAMPEYANLLSIRDSLPEGHPMRADLDARIKHLSGGGNAKTLIEHNFSVGNDMVQPHVSYDEGRTWQPLPGSQPSAKFARQLPSGDQAPSDRIIQDPASPTGWSYQDRRNPANLHRGAPPPAGGRGAPGALPAPALKLQQEELDAIGIASSISADLAAVEQQLQSGALKLSPIGNVESGVRNFTGFSNANSRNYLSFRTTLEKLRNDSLRLNKGVQTEGDAVRAWNELLTNINDEGVVKQRLAEIQRINQRAANFRRMNIDAIRANYGLGPLDVSGYENPPAALGAPRAPQQQPRPGASPQAPGVRVVDW